VSINAVKFASLTRIQKGRDISRPYKNLYQFID